MKDLAIIMILSISICFSLILILVPFYSNKKICKLIEKENKEIKEERCGYINNFKIGKYYYRCHHCSRPAFNFVEGYKPNSGDYMLSETVIYDNTTKPCPGDEIICQYCKQRIIGLTTKEVFKKENGN